MFFHTRSIAVSGKVDRFLQKINSNRSVECVYLRRKLKTNARACNVMMSIHNA